MDDKAEENTARGAFEIVNRLGLHARAAAKLVRLAGRFHSKVEVAKDGQHADAKSVMGVLLLCGVPGATLEVSARGQDAQAAVDAIGELIQDRFGEDS
ncbi:MAG: HPr family phosphocarrier protein [Polyangiales bacterium]